ncbi:MAG: hypothetical protein MK104_12410 [Erythrobacter sp.]|jgi:hypothetical protein|uniref:hypothetical protein n=1 Tax=Qipengyuania pacifica TaxID=2860199 RepID=UPI0035C83A18|nr:hypothetical protein [Erythrobacter sp.]
MSISSHKHANLTSLSTELFGPAVFGPLFLRPRLVANTPALAHVPLLFWVCAALRPRHAVVIGVGQGVLHFAVCQALERIGGVSSCRGVGFWGLTADDHGSANIPEELLEHQNMLYEDISTLEQGDDLESLVDGIKDASVDLIVLDLTSAPEGLLQRAQTLLDCLHQSGVLLVYGTDSIKPQSADAAAIERLFSKFNSASFQHDKGLTLFNSDGEIPSQLIPLMSVSEAGALAPEVGRLFRRVGQGILGSVQANYEKSARVQAERQASESELARVAAEELNEALNAANNAHVRSVAEIQSELFDERLRVAQMVSQVAALESRTFVLQSEHDKKISDEIKKTENIRIESALSIERLNAEIDNLREELSDELKLKSDLLAASEDRQALRAAHADNLRTIQDELSRTQKALKIERNTRFSETLALTQMLEALNAEMGTLKEEHRASLISQRDKQAKHQYIQSMLNASRERLQIDLLQPHRLVANRRAKKRFEKNMEAVRVSGLFDNEWYLATYSDVEESGADPLQHFLARGCYELRNPGPDFDSLKYHIFHMDVTEAGIPAIIHFVCDGKQEGRQIFAVGD